MGLYLKQNENRSELQQRLDAELRAKANAKRARDTDSPDGVDDSVYIENTKQTTSLAGVWVLLLIVALVLFAGLVIVASRG